MLDFKTIGKAGRLRSLNEFIDRASHSYAARVYSGKLKIDTINTIKGKKFFFLISFYLIGKLDSYLSWFLREPDRGLH